MSDDLGMQNVQINTIDDIADYIMTMKIKKSMMGGFDRTDVYVKLQTLHEMYQDFFENESADQKKIIEEQENRLRQLKEQVDLLTEENKKLKQGGGVSPAPAADAGASMSLEKENEYKREIDSLRDQLRQAQNAQPAGSSMSADRENEYRREIDSLRDQLRQAQNAQPAGASMSMDRENEYRREIDSLRDQLRQAQNAQPVGASMSPERENEYRREIETLKDQLRQVEDRNRSLQNELVTAKAMGGTNSFGGQGYSSGFAGATEPDPRAYKNTADQDMYTATAVLQEAYKEGQRIVEQAKIEAEKEAIKIRVGYRYEMENYNAWKEKTKEEKMNLLNYFSQIEYDIQATEDKIKAIKTKIVSDAGEGDQRVEYQ